MKRFCIFLLALLFCVSLFAEEPSTAGSNILSFVTLKPAPQNKNSEFYIQSILQQLQDAKTLNGILDKILINPKRVLSENERGILLALCAYEQSMQREKIAPEIYAVVKENVGELPYLNIFFTDGKADNYKLYSLSANRFIFIQLIGKGAHNDAFLVWLIQQDAHKIFQFRLLKVTADESNYILQGSSVFFDKKTLQIIAKSNGKEMHYSISDNYLIQSK